MATEPKNPNRISDTPRDKPVTERTEHANLDRPGAQAHPRAARDWSAYTDPIMAWRLR
jgi:hypothetical protein